MGEQILVGNNSALKTRLINAFHATALGWGILEYMLLISESRSYSNGRD
jgi:hypothetical protein